MENDFIVLKLLKENKIENAKKIINNIYFNNKKKYNYYMGLICCFENRYSEAIKHFNCAIEFGYSNYLVYYNLGVAYLEINSLKPAENCFLKSIYKNNSFSKSYINLAYIYIKNGDNKKAYRIIKTCLAFTDSEQIEEIEKKLLKVI